MCGGIPEIFQPQSCGESKMSRSGAALSCFISDHLTRNHAENMSETCDKLLNGSRYS